MFLWNTLLCLGWCNFFKNNILQGSVATPFRYGENFNDSFLANFFRSLSVKKFENRSQLGKAMINNARAWFFWWNTMHKFICLFKSTYFFCFSFPLLLSPFVFLCCCLSPFYFHHLSSLLSSPKSSWDQRRSQEFDLGGYKWVKETKQQDKKI